MYKEVLGCACAPSHKKKTRIKKLIRQLKTQEAHIRKAHKGGKGTEKRGELDSWFGELNLLLMKSSKFGFERVQRARSQNPLELSPECRGRRSKEGASAPIS